MKEVEGSQPDGEEGLLYTTVAKRLSSERVTFSVKLSRGSGWEAQRRGESWLGQSRGGKVTQPTQQDRTCDLPQQVETTMEPEHPFPRPADVHFPQGLTLNQSHTPTAQNRTRPSCHPPQVTKQP